MALRDENSELHKKNKYLDDVAERLEKTALDYRDEYRRLEKEIKALQEELRKKATVEKVKRRTWWLV